VCVAFFVLYLLFSMLLLSLDCPFLIVSLVFSNVYLWSESIQIMLPGGPTFPSPNTIEIKRPSSVCN
jgi:hypothetical protein